MTCPHCGLIQTPCRPFDRPIEGGRAFAQVCVDCHRVVGVRPHLPTDPPALPDGFSSVEIARLHFVQWRLRGDCLAQVSRLRRPDGLPVHRAA